MQLTSLLALSVLLLVPSGLEIQDIKEGTGSKAENGDRLTVTYKGTLTDGKVFDSSEDKPPFVFVLGEGKVIQGWDKGLVGMKVKGKRKLTIPPELAYGDKELEDIPANSTLIFEVELLRVDKKGQKPMLEIEEIEEGSGEVAKSGDTVEIKYAGEFLNGKEFDSGKFSFGLGSGQVIKGFDQGVTGMKQGGKRKITVPPEMGYGERGAPPVIPPNSTLVFTVEVVSIK